MLNKERILKLLERLLWARTGNDCDSCPCCDQNKVEKYGHRKDCELGLMLTELGNTEQKFQK